MGKTKIYTKKEARAIIEQAMVALGLSDDMQTSPGIIWDIVIEFKLDDFKTKNPIIRRFFKDALAKPQPLTAMLSSIKEGIVAKHPAIIEFVAKSLEKDWFKPSEQILRGIHVAYVLEELTAAMCNNHEVLIEVQRHYKHRERALDIDIHQLLHSFIQTFVISHDVFGTFKTLSVDPAMIWFHLQREQLGGKQAAKLLHAKKLNYLEYKYLTPLHAADQERINEILQINIYEAGISEYTRGLQENAVCAYVLAQDILNRPPKIAFCPESRPIAPENTFNHFYRAVSEKSNRSFVMDFDQAWVSLYTTWNMAFVLFTYSDLDLLMPKLFIPSVIDALPENFASARIISLWLTINHYLFRLAESKHASAPENKIAMAKQWAAINRRYALAFESHDIPNKSTVLRGFRHWFGHPFYHFAGLLKEFFTD